MKRNTAKKINVLLYVCLLTIMPILVYFQIKSYVLMIISLVGVMFAISMVMFWLSTREHENKEQKMKQKSL